MTSQSTSETGRARRERAQGAHADALQARLASLDPQMATWADEYIFGEVWGRQGMSHDERMIVAIAVLAAGGHVNLLRNYLFGALQDGIAPRRIHEALVMLNVYVGFPAAVSSLWEWRRVLEKAVEGGFVSVEAAGELDGGLAGTDNL